MSSGDTELIKRAYAAFNARDLEGALATIGRHSAIADLRWTRLTGWPAWVLWGIVHIFFLIGFRNRVAVFLNWVWAWLTYGRGARLITGETSTLIFGVPEIAQPSSGAAAAQTAETRLAFEKGDREDTPANASTRLPTSWSVPR